MMKNWVAAMALGVLAFGSASANAAGNEQYPLTVQHEETRKECGDCHMVFPPNRLTKGGWKKIMKGLSDHFGEDASLDKGAVKSIQAFLVSKAFDARDTYPTKLKLQAWKKKGLVDPIRITVTPGWLRHHKTAKYKRMSKEIKYTRGANCIICHKNAERGMYEEFDGLYGIAGD